MAVSDVTTGAPAGTARPAPRRPAMAGTWLTYFLAVVGALLLWQLLSLFVNPLFLPGPLQVGRSAVELTGSGELPQHVGVSYFRVLSGWVIGAVLAIPLGLLAGRVKLLRVALEPFLNFFRFVPPIAFLSLSLIWLGIGETSKIALIVYASLFIVFLNTIAGVQAIDEEKLRAAQCLGASRLQLLSTVIVPATIPDIVTGLRTAMGISFMTVVAAELVAAESGVGYLIYNSRLFARTDYVFVGIVTLGLMGLLADLVFRWATTPVRHRYAIKF
ncbi:ABC transporter permease [Blastococcus deserti]|uniref:ABC transporter permease n=1 Tax=Blastococcus deserti TaxID=2259033 RepID=A0ABW4XG39_9ACTN